MPRVGWYLDVKTITVLYVFFFFSVGDLDERDTVKPKGKVCVGREGPLFSIFFFFFFFGIHPPKTLSANLRHSHKVFSFDLGMCGPVGQV